MDIRADGMSMEVPSFGPGTADLGFVAATGTAIVPHMQENRVAAYDLSAYLD